MPVSALLLTVDARTSRETLDALARDPRVTVGEVPAVKVPIVVDTASADEGEALSRALEDLPGVHFVDLVLVDFSSDEDPCSDATS